MSGHLSWETLNDLAGDVLDAPARRVAIEHADGCDECRSTVETLRRTIEAAGQLPRSIEPPPEVWQSIRGSIDASKVAVLPAVPRSQLPWWASPRRLAVAATALVVASSALTAIVMRPSPDPAGERVTVREASLPREWKAAEAGYLASVSELHEQLEEQRASLAPATVATVERTLAVIDSAIAEARGALLRDPANAALADLLASNYRQKVELLRRATQLDPRS